MSSALNRAEHYRGLAQECRHLAATTFSSRMKSRYSWMAEIYMTLAEAEVIRRTSLGRLAAPAALVEKLPPQTERLGLLQQADGWRLAR
jgi:secreted PhoX family phosphatase